MNGRMEEKMGLHGCKEGKQGLYGGKDCTEGGVTWRKRRYGRKEGMDGRIVYFNAKRKDVF